MKNGKREFEHRRIWEKINGKIPDGYFIHHINNNKKDNRIDNLELVKDFEHKQIHLQGEFLDGVWWRRCKVCEVYKPRTKEFWYIFKGKWVCWGMCSICHKEYMKEYYKKNKQKWRKYMKEYYKKNKQKWRKYMKEYYKKHKEVKKKK